MVSRRALFVMAVLVTAASLFGCATRDEYVERRIEDARLQASRRQYDDAQATLQEVIDQEGTVYAVVLERARIMMRAHDYEGAASWFAAAADVRPTEAEPVVGRFEARLNAAAGDSAAVETVLADASAFLDSAPDSLLNMTVFVRTCSEAGRDDDASDVRERLVRMYPDSEEGSDLIKEECDEIAVERDDETRLTMARSFLDRHPVTRWRNKVIVYELVSLRRLGRHDDVAETARARADEGPDDPELLDSIAAAMAASKVALDEAASYARRAVELNDDPSKSAPRRLTLARALLEAGNFEEALSSVTEALSSLDVGPDDEETGAAYRYVEGRALEGLGRHEEALDAYISALVAGGRQNRWAARADTAAAALYVEEFPAKAAARPLIDHARERRGYSGPVFTDVTEASGLGGRRESRVAWGDFDGDGRDDLLLSGRVLFRNAGDGTFEDVTDTAGIGGTGANGGVWADFDNDGALDFYATCGATEGEATDRLWHNEGDGTFSDWTERAGGVSDLYTTEGAAWGDADEDGLVDLYLASYERPSGGDWSLLGRGFPDILYINRGDGTFADESAARGIVPPFGKDLSGRGVNWGDYDNDGDLDIYVSNYRLQENFLWRNDGGRFTNVAPELDVSGTETEGWWGHTIGSEWGDFDNDGDLDLVCANLAHPRYIEVSDMTMLYENVGAAREPFRETRSLAGIKYAETHSDPSWGDVDADGDLDLFITSIYPNCGTFLYLNDGRGAFEDVTWLAGARSYNGWGSAMSDYDGDGDLDMAVGSGSGFRLLRNDGPCGDRAERKNHWLSVRPVGTRSNAAAIGARVTVTRGRTRQIREIEGGKGTTSQHSLCAFFGLGPRAGAVDVEVAFLGGAKVVLEDVTTDRVISVVEPK